jgi:hypothetical protein
MFDATLSVTSGASPAADFWPLRRQIAEQRSSTSSTALRCEASTTCVEIERRRDARMTSGGASLFGLFDLQPPRKDGPTAIGAILLEVGRTICPRHRG